MQFQIAETINVSSELNRYLSVFLSSDNSTRTETQNSAHSLWPPRNHKPVSSEFRNCARAKEPIDNTFPTGVSEGNCLSSTSPLFEELRPVKHRYFHSHHFAKHLGEDAERSRSAAAGENRVEIVAEPAARRRLRRLVGHHFNRLTPTAFSIPSTFILYAPPDLNISTFGMKA